MEINLIHKKMSEKETYENIKRLHKQNPDVFMSPNKWKKMRELKKKIEDLRREIDYLYLYPPASMSVIERREKELESLSTRNSKKSHPDVEYHMSREHKDLRKQNKKESLN